MHFAAGIAVFGPNKDAARIEGSKAFAKDVMAAQGVRTAHAEAITPGASSEDIDAAIDRFGPTWVVKDDGLAAGKGVVVTPDRAAARAHVDAVLEGGNPVLLESFLDGPEVSLFCLVDGETVVPLLPAQDHKRAYDNDEGPNTGGMGAYAYFLGCLKMASSALSMRSAFLLLVRWWHVVARTPVCFTQVSHGVQKALQ